MWSPKGIAQSRFSICDFIHWLKNIAPYFLLSLVLVSAHPPHSPTILCSPTGAAELGPFSSLMLRLRPVLVLCGNSFLITHEYLSVFWLYLSPSMAASPMSLVLNWGWVCSQGNIWKHLETFCLTHLGGGMLLAFSGWSPETLLNILQCTGQPVTTKNYLASGTNRTKVKEPVPGHWFIHYLPSVLMFLST